MDAILCSCCETEFSVIFNEAVTEGELTYCPFCSEKLYLKDDVPKAAWYDDEDDEDDEAL